MKGLILCVNCIPTSDIDFITIEEEMSDVMHEIDKKSLDDPYTKRGVLLREAARLSDLTDTCLVTNTTTELGRETLGVFMEKATFVFVGTK